MNLTDRKFFTSHQLGASSTHQWMMGLALQRANGYSPIID